jgi:D-alanyl-D-alanine carboxypeptidase
VGKRARVALVVGSVLALTVGSSGPAGAAPRAPVGRAALAAVARAVQEATNAPGAIVAVQRGSRPPLIVARGTTDRRSGTALRADDAFPVASASKSFTAAVVLHLVARGRLHLDDRVVDHVPGWDRRIRVRHLLDHTSGLPSWGNKDDPDGAFGELVRSDFDRTFTMAESLAFVRDRPLLFAPGHGTHYSNANTILAGLVVEAVTGDALARAYHREVLDPLGLEVTAYPPQETAPRPPVPGVLFVDGPGTPEVDTGQYPQTSLRSLGGPAAAMVSSAPELLRFARAFLRGDFPDRRLAARARRIGPGGTGLGVVGFGPAGACVFDGCPEGTRFARYGFAGNTDGAAVRVVHDPARDATVLVFANSSQRGRLDPFVDRLLDRLPRVSRT